MQIWPAIDIRDGKCVRLTQGDYAQMTVYGDNPADMAHRFVSDGATGLHIVDLDAARDGTWFNKQAIGVIAGEVDVPCQLGGGIRSQEIIPEYLEMGIERLVVGTKALTDPKWLAEMSRQFPGQLLVGIDARHGRVTTNGWLKTSDTLAVDLAKQISDNPLAGIIYTDISRDGMMSGPNFAAMQEMADVVEMPLIASGGVTTAEDISRLAAMGLAGCVIGKALYEGRLTLTDAIYAASQPNENPQPTRPG